MRIWLPYIAGGSGADVSTRFLASGFQAAGQEALAQAYPHAYQYFPWGLLRARPPDRTDAIVTSTWSGFVFHRPRAINVTVERLFVLDPALRPYKSFAQDAFHRVLVRHYVRRSVATADAVTSVSAYSGTQLARTLRVAFPKTILNAVDINFFRPREPDPRPEERRSRPFRLLFVGNFTRRKGADLLPVIMAKLGEGYELRYTSGIQGRTAAETAPNMRCIGTLSLEQVREAYRDADALLFPTRLEGLPRTVMEAMACGTPAIASDACSLPEAIDHGRDGLLCPLDDVDAFVSAVRALAGDPVRWSSMAAAARESAVRKFSLSRMVGEYLELFEALADGPLPRYRALARNEAGTG